MTKVKRLSVIPILSLPYSSSRKKNKNINKIRHSVLYGLVLLDLLYDILTLTIFRVTQQAAV